MVEKTNVEKFLDRHLHRQQHVAAASPQPPRGSPDGPTAAKTEDTVTVSPGRGKKGGEASSSGTRSRGRGSDSAKPHRGGRGRHGDEREEKRKALAAEKEARRENERAHASRALEGREAAERAEELARLAEEEQALMVEVAQLETLAAQVTPYALPCAHPRTHIALR